MKKIYRSLIFTAIIMVVIIIIIGSISVSRYEQYLSGLWIGDPTFLNDAHLSDFQLFISPRENGTRQGYLIITNLNGEFISNQAIEINEQSHISNWMSATCSSFKTNTDVYNVRTIEINYDNEDDDPPMPKLLKMTISLLNGSLSLYDEQKVYAFMRKDFAASAAAIEVYSV